MTSRPMRLTPWYPYLSIDFLGPRHLTPQAPAPVTRNPILLPPRTGGSIGSRPVAQELLYALHYAGRLRDAFHETPDCRHPDYPPVPFLDRAATFFTFQGADYDTQDPAAWEYLHAQRPGRFIDAERIWSHLSLEDDSSLALPLPFAVCGTGGALEEDYLFVLSNAWPPAEADFYGLLERACFTYLEDSGADSIPTQLETFRLKAADVLQPHFRPGLQPLLDKLTQLLRRNLGIPLPPGGQFTIDLSGDRPHATYVPNYIYQTPLPAYHPDTAS